MKHKFILSSVLLAVSAATTVVHAAPPEWAANRGNQGNNANKANKPAAAYKKGPQNNNADKQGPGISAREKAIENHKRDNLATDLVYAGITAALARSYAQEIGIGGYSDLPPGIRKNLARGKSLPPGIAKKTVPGNLLSRLPKHKGYNWRIAGRDLVLVAATGIVADILYDVFD